jgi:hypothetical protein
VFKKLLLIFEGRVPPPGYKGYRLVPKLPQKYNKNENLHWGRKYF